MSALQDKYKQLIDTANNSGISNLQISEQGNILHIDGDVPDGATKDKLWNIYNEIDPDYRAGDLMMDVNVAVSSGSKAKVTTDSTNLNIRKGPGTDQKIVGKAAHGEIVTIQSKTNNQWWLIKTNSGVEGYAFAQYLSPQ
ncbi:MAG: SH3 domain-containing protein [Ginsengibacter sp.]